MRIQICPVKRLYQLLGQRDPDNCAGILSSASEIDAAKLRGLPHVFRQYDDLDYECPGRSFSVEDAEAFACFLKELDRDVRTLYCCCDAGESRSPAVAAAVMRYFRADDMSIWRNPKYHPNMLVYAMLTQALGVPVSDDELDCRIYENRKAFQAAIRGTP